MNYKLGLLNQIKKRIAGLVVKVLPLPEHKPSGKPVEMQGARIVLVFSYSNDDELKIIKTFVTNSKQHHNLNAVVVYNGKNNSAINEDYDNIIFVNQNDFNFLGKSKQRLTNWLKDHNFSVLISLVDKSDLFCDKIISNTLSNFKAGNYDANNVSLFDLTINQKENDYNKQLDIFLHYIKILNINK